MTASPYLIFSFITAIKDLCNSIRLKDKAYIAESLVNVLNLPLGIASSIERAIILILNLIIQGAIITTLSLSASIIGFVFLGIQLGIEIVNLRRTLEFSNHHQIKRIKNFLKLLDRSADLSEFVRTHESELFSFLCDPSSIESLPTEKVSLKNFLCDQVLSKLFKENLTLSPKEVDESVLSISEVFSDDDLNQITKEKFKIKIERLKRRIQPIGIKKIENYFTSSENALTAPQLISFLDTQINKTALTHIVGIIAITLAIVSLALSFAFASPLIPALICIGGLLFELPRSFAPGAFLDQDGYTWDWKECLPPFLQKKLSHIQFPKTLCG
jgi:hypothetical protein